MTRLLLKSQKAIRPLRTNSRSPPDPDALTVRVSAPAPATVTGASMLMSVSALSVRLWALAQLSARTTSMESAPLAVVTSTSEASSILARSVTFRTAFLAVGEHTPAEQLMFLVGLEEISTDANAESTRLARAVETTTAQSA